MPSSSICSENLLIGHAGDSQPFSNMLSLLNSIKQQDIAVSEFNGTEVS
jgi:hypothetical protein